MPRKIRLSVSKRKIRKHPVILRGAFLCPIFERNRRLKGVY
nr:MAG TPA: hypothetical protein [Caudoviricetes sp.]